MLPSGLMRPMPSLGQVVESSFPSSDHLHHAAMTLRAAVDRGLRALDDVAQHVVQRAENLTRLGVMTGFEFCPSAAHGRCRRLWASPRPRSERRSAQRSRACPCPPGGTHSSRCRRWRACSPPTAARPADRLLLVALYAGLALFGSGSRQFGDRCGRCRCNLWPSRGSQREQANKKTKGLKKYSAHGLSFVLLWSCICRIDAGLSAIKLLTSMAEHY